MAETAQTDRPQVLDRPLESGSAIARFIVAAGLAGIITGLLVGGLGSRLFMRIAGAAGGADARGLTTEAGFSVGEITIGGTLELVVFIGVATGLVAGVLYAVFRRWLAWALRWRGLAFGVLLFAIVSATSDVMNPDNIDFALLGAGGLIVAVIFGLFLAFGVVIEWMCRAMDRRLPKAQPTYWAPAAVGALLGLPLTAQVMFSSEVCDCDPPLLVGASVVVAAVGTLLTWFAGVRAGAGSLAPIGRVLGLAGTAGALLFGLARAASDAAEIIRG